MAYPPPTRQTSRIGDYARRQATTVRESRDPTPWAELTSQVEYTSPGCGFELTRLADEKGPRLASGALTKGGSCPSGAASDGRTL